MVKAGEVRQDRVRGVKWTAHKVLAGGDVVVRVQALGSDYFTTVPAEEWRELPR